MTWLRVPVAIFALVHGLGHAIWFAGAWIPRTGLVTDRPWILPGEVTIESPLGKVLGLLSLAALVGFAAAAFALFTEEGWWRPTLMASSAVSLVAVVPWWRSSPGTTALNAALADVGLFVFALLPVAEDLIDAA